MPGSGSLFFLLFGLPITLLTTVIACPFFTHSLGVAGHPVLANVCITVVVITVVAVVAFVIRLGEIYASLLPSRLRHCDERATADGHRSGSLLRRQYLGPGARRIALRFLWMAKA